jgi:hypothetical protein
MSDDGDIAAESPEMLAVLFDSSKQLVITAGNSGVIRVRATDGPGCCLGQSSAACRRRVLATLKMYPAIA